MMRNSWLSEWDAALYPTRSRRAVDPRLTQARSEQDATPVAALSALGPDRSMLRRQFGRISSGS